MFALTHGYTNFYSFVYVYANVLFLLLTALPENQPAFFLSKTGFAGCVHMPHKLRC